MVSVSELKYLISEKSPHLNEFGQRKSLVFGIVNFCSDACQDLFHKSFISYIGLGINKKSLGIDIGKLALE